MATNTSINNTSVDAFLVKGNLQVGIPPPAIYPMTVTRSTSGTVQVEVRNTSSTSTSNAVLELSTATGNPYVVFTSSGTSYSMGMDNSASNAFKINNGLTLSSTPAFQISSAGLWSAAVSIYFFSN